MNITGWPYIITVEGDLGARTSGRLTLDFATTPSDETFEQVRFAVESFFALAEAGGLGGDRLDPLHSTALLSTNAPAIHVTSFVWELTTIAIDPRGLVVLFNMLALLGKDIRTITLQVPGSGPSAPFSTGDFPPMWPNVPFYVDDDRTGPNVEMHIEFVQDVPHALHDMVIDAVEAWLNCGMVQGYRDWSEPADSSFLIPLSDPTFNFIDDSLMGQVQDKGLAEGCYDIFFNVLMKLHARTSIRSVDLL